MALNLIPLLAIAGLGAWALTRKKKAPSNLKVLKSPGEANVFHTILLEEEREKTATKPYIIFIEVPQRFVHRYARQNPGIRFFSTTRAIWNQTERGIEYPLPDDEWVVAGMPVVGQWAYDGEGEGMALPISENLIDLFIMFVKTGATPEGAALGGGRSIL
jgi:hypothetical protein